MLDYEGEKNMNNRNSGRKDTHYYEDENENENETMNNKNCNFDFEFNIDEANEYFIKGMGNINDGDYEEIYQKGFKDGYDKAKQELLDYIEKNKSSDKYKYMQGKKYKY